MDVVAFFVVIVWIVPAQAGEEISLALYQPSSQSNAANVVWYERLFSCKTDAQGRCEIAGEMTAWRDGLLRGEIRSRLGIRPVIWPGGKLHLRLQTAEAAASETRYETLDAASVPEKMEAKEHGGVPSVLLIALAVFALYSSFRIYAASKSAHREGAHEN